MGAAGVDDPKGIPQKNLFSNQLGIYISNIPGKISSSEEIWFYFFHLSKVYIWMGIFIAVYVVLVRHRDNIKRLLNGTEPKIGSKK